MFEKFCSIAEDEVLHDRYRLKADDQFHGWRMAKIGCNMSSNKSRKTYIEEIIPCH